MSNGCVCATLRNETQIESNELMKMQPVYYLLGFMVNVIYCFIASKNYYVINALPDM